MPIDPRTGQIYVSGMQGEVDPAGTEAALRRSYFGDGGRVGIVPAGGGRFRPAGGRFLPGFYGTGAPTRGAPSIGLGQVLGLDRAAEAGRAAAQDPFEIERRAVAGELRELGAGAGGGLTARVLEGPRRVPREGERRPFIEPEPGAMTPEEEAELRRSFTEATTREETIAESIRRAEQEQKAKRGQLLERYASLQPEAIRRRALEEEEERRFQRQEGRVERREEREEERAVSGREFALAAQKDIAKATADIARQAQAARSKQEITVLEKNIDSASALLKQQGDLETARALERTKVDIAQRKEEFERRKEEFGIKERAGIAGEQRAEERGIRTERRGFQRQEDLLSAVQDRTKDPYDRAIAAQRAGVISPAEFEGGQIQRGLSAIELSDAMTNKFAAEDVEVQDRVDTQAADALGSVQQEMTNALVVAGYEGLEDITDAYSSPDATEIVLRELDNLEAAATTRVGKARYDAARELVVRSINNAVKRGDFGDPLAQEAGLFAPPGGFWQSAFNPFDRIASFWGGGAARLSSRLRQHFTNGGWGKVVGDQVSFEDTRKRLYEDHLTRKGEVAGRRRRAFGAARRGFGAFGEITGEALAEEAAQ